MLTTPRSRAAFWNILFVGLVLLIQCSHASETPSNSTQTESTISCTVVVAAEEVECSGVKFTHGEETLTPDNPLFYAFLGGSIFLVLLAGLVSGLTIGLMSMDKMNLEILKNSGDARQASYAKRVLPVVEKRHLLLVTLLLTNAAAMEALPILLDRISSPIIAIIVSVTAVLFFGEIIPQALCSRFGLAIGANMAWFVRVLMFILFPLGWPISKLLDWILGADHATYFKRGELKELVQLHTQDKQGGLTIDEATIIKGALDMKHKTVKDCLTPLDKVFMLEINARMDRNNMMLVKQQRHSRIPVYKETKQNILGIMLVKSLLFVDMEESPVISEFELREIPKVASNAELFDVLNLFQTGRSHMASVFDATTKDTLGIVTLEDIIEELIQEEILDEDDLADEYQQRAMQILQKAKKARKGLNHLSLRSSKKLGNSNASNPLKDSGKMESSEDAVVTLEEMDDSFGMEGGMVKSSSTHNLSPLNPRKDNIV